MRNESQFQLDDNTNNTVLCTISVFYTKSYTTFAEHDKILEKYNTIIWQLNYILTVRYVTINMNTHLH